MSRSLLGQIVGLVVNAVWLAALVYCMSRAATPNATDAGNWFVLFAVITVAFIALHSYWKRFFAPE